MKATVTLGGVALAGNSSVVWRFTTGTGPYMTAVQVHESDIANLRSKFGKPLTLTIRDARGVTTNIKKVYPLYEGPSDSKYRRTVVIADQRWQWSYKLVVRDYNIPRKTGDRNLIVKTPVELTESVDIYDFLPYSLKDEQQRWTAKQIIEDVLDVIQDGEGSYTVESWPLEEGGGKKGGRSGGNSGGRSSGGSSGNSGGLTIQNVQLRDQGNAALARALAYVPGADVYINTDGQVVVYDATDLQAAGQYLRGLQHYTRAGEYPIEVKRNAIRPAKVRPHYQREIELMFKFVDDYRAATSSIIPGPDDLFLENVVLTTDPETTIKEFDWETKKTVEKKVAAGTWVSIDKWLQAMNDDRPSNSLEWTFKTISLHWVAGDLEAVLGAGGLDIDPDANQATRVATLRRHFRQTFRINPRYMKRIRSLRNVRAAVVDPVSGARQPSCVWGQACIIMNEKGARTAARGVKDPTKTSVFRNVDYIEPLRANPSKKTVFTPVAPAAVSIVDEELGIIQIDWRESPYGITKSIVPSLLVDGNNIEKTVNRDMEEQDTRPVLINGQIESSATGLSLAKTMELRCIMTVVPCAPNNEKQFHIEEVEASDIEKVFRSEFGIAAGSGPDLDVFIPPGEYTARFAWFDDEACQATAKALFGLVGQLEGDDLPGFIFTNRGDSDSGQFGESRVLRSHALAVAAEQLADFADSWQGAVASAVSSQGMKIVGNMADAAIRVAQAPSAKVDAQFTFPGQPRKLSRFSLLPESVRTQILGTLPYKN